ncbi:MAG: efflux RND transporter periplasmic adaptor subunit [Dehalococcoidia bacterium]|nr:efflux RND transporter periplasmic adaptor subunit [Dehalococcoidia bacterium]
MKKGLFTAVLVVLVASMVGLAGCGGGEEEEAEQRQIVAVERGDLVTTVTADGNLDMPHQVQLRFGTPGSVEEVYVEEGDKVREGTLLAKLDDTAHKLAIANAQYDVELAMNDLVEKIDPALMGYPKGYPNPSVILWVEQAQEELEEAQQLLEENSYQEAAAELRLAQHDLEATYYMLNDPVIAAASEYHNELGQVLNRYPQIPKAVDLLEQDQERLADVQNLMNQGDYGEASAKLHTVRVRLEETHRLVKSMSGRIRVSQRLGACCGNLTTQSGGATGLMTLPYPDTSTSLDWLRQVEEELQEMQNLMEDGDYDELEMATLLRLAQHDMEMSQTVLEDNELIFRSGFNLKVLRAYNLNLQKADLALENAKDDLMNTEILAPFDGTVVDVGVKEKDQLSSFDYASKTAVHLVDTRTVKMEGVVDEIDIYQVEVGQEVIVVVDAMPDEEVSGEVAFISPFGTEEAGVVEFAVTIELDPTEIELKGGLTATADIVVQKSEDVLLIPYQAVKESPEGWWVEVVVDDATGETEQRQVVLGTYNEYFYEVVSGLDEGEKVIVEGRGRMPVSF